METHLKLLIFNAIKYLLGNICAAQHEKRSTMLQNLFCVCFTLFNLILLEYNIL